MATNKHAIIRYQTLDTCFSNTGKRYYIEDLLAACNEAIFEFDTSSNGIKKRQLYDDIRFMQSAQGWSIPLEKIKDGRRAYYRYEDTTFSINNQPLNVGEAAQLKAAMLVLSRFKGLPQFEWVHELIPKLDKTFKLSNKNQEIISFETNPFLKGTEHIAPLFKAIQNKQSLTIEYQSFKNTVAQTIIFHPYYLKQYNNRWFLFGKHHDYNNLTNLALDRIQSIAQNSHTFDESERVDFEDYFDDFIGVTKPKGKELTKIIIKTTSQLAPYIKTKPLHGSQTKIEETKDFYVFSIKVLPNYELEKLLLSHGEDIEVVAPPFFRNQLKKRIKKQLENY